MQKLIASVTSRLVISVPYLWLLVFFLVPFLIVFKISLSEGAMAIPPYTPVLDITAGIRSVFNSVSQFSWDNYIWLVEDPLYYKAYISSLLIAAVSTLLTLIIGYPIAYGMARAPASVQPDICLCLSFFHSGPVFLFAFMRG